MNILFPTAEAAPFAKVGGLGDVIAAGSLPTALRELDIDARVILPLYGTIDRSRFNIKPIFNFPFYRRTGTTYISIHYTEWENVPFYFIEALPFFGVEQSVYLGWHQDMPRYIFFNQVAMAAAWELKQREGWFPDIFHVNDWHTGLIPFFVRNSQSQTDWANLRTMMTIHNMAHQGNYAGGWLWELGVAGRNDEQLLSLGLGDNMLGIGIKYADYVTTVSPRHADEIQYAYMGYGLEDLIRDKTYSDKLYGVLNGIDVVKFDPETDPHIPQNFTPKDFQKRRQENKKQLQSFAELTEDPSIPIMGIVSRLVWQKGMELAVPAIRQILSEQNVQFIALGTGDPDLSAQLWQISQEFPDKARVFIQYDNAIAQRIYAGSDMFIMPSHYEPCGIGQMIAMRYGSLPIVRETGGLADTVENFDNEEGAAGTGFVFQWEEISALTNTIRWALNTYREKPEAWQKMQKRAMEQDFSWKRSAQIYHDLYQKLMP